MELRHLRHFIGVVDAGSFSRAAQNLNITQPALTRSIHILEHQLRTQLLHRQARGVVPTETGRLFMRHAKLILNEMQAAREEMAAVLDGARGHVHVGVGSPFANRVIDTATAALLRKAPNVTVSVTVGMFEEMSDMLHDGGLDFIFSVTPPATENEEIVFEPLLDVNSLIVASAAHPLAKVKTVSLAQLQASRWVMMDQRHAAAFLDTFFAADGLSAPSVAVRTNSLELMRALLQKEDLLAIIPSHWIAEDVEAGRLVVLNAPNTPVQRRAGLVYRKGYKRAAAEMLIEEVRAACKQQPTTPVQPAPLAKAALRRATKASPAKRKR
jgi:DNA-binding transcriptional LysR family regulator